MDIRVGHGYDIHRFVEGRELVLGGVKVTYPRGFDAHSDGDVILHALSDALLGAAGLGDIGEHFPDTDPRYRNAASMDIARHLHRIVLDRGFRVLNADVTIVMEEPRLHPYKERIRRSLAELLEVDVERVNLKAKTKERLDAVGQGKAAEATATVLIAREES